MSTIANGMSSVKPLLRSHLGTFVSSALATVGTVAIIWDNHVGRNHAANNIDTKFDGVNTKFDGVNTKFDAKFDGVNRQMLICQNMIMQIGYHTISALDGNKIPIREWLQKVERYQQSGADCSSIPKVEDQ